MKYSNNTYDLQCEETKEIEKMYSDQTMLTYVLMAFSIFTFSLMIVLVP